MTTAVPARALGRGALAQVQPPGLLDEAARLAVAGFALDRPHWDGVICLPGDPGHWVHLSAGEIVSFQSFLTARLAHALGASDTPCAEALADTMARPERLATQLASADLGKDRDALAGHLLGAELAAARAYWLGQQVVMLGDDAGRAAALEAQGVPVERGDRGAMERAAREALGA